MPTVSINDQDITRRNWPQMSINEIINDVINEATEKKHIITGIKLDGQELKAGDDNLCLKENQKLEFTTQSALEISREALNACGHYIDVIIAKIHRISKLYSQNKLPQANQSFADLIETIELFIQLVSKLKHTLKKYRPESYKKLDHPEIELHTLAILKALVPAKEKEDIIMLSDLLEYELVDNLTMWKNIRLPQLQAMHPLEEAPQ
ncbi:MAG: hypothetical protein J6Y94_08580 [Bacteriovoracaceae bacterium]|nr:hypothetical protein [Bacteriovoracaceae bacterium]